MYVYMILYMCIRIFIYIYFFFFSPGTICLCYYYSTYLSYSLCLYYIHTYILYIYTIYIYIFIDWLYTHDHVAVIYNSLLYTDMICFCVPELIDGRRVTWLSFVSCCHAGHLRLRWFSHLFGPTVDVGDDRDFHPGIPERTLCRARWNSRDLPRPHQGNSGTLRAIIQMIYRSRRSDPFRCSRLCSESR